MVCGIVLGNKHFGSAGSWARVELSDGSRKWVSLKQPSQLKACWPVELKPAFDSDKTEGAITESLLPDKFGTDIQAFKNAGSPPRVPRPVRAKVASAAKSKSSKYGLCRLSVSCCAFFFR